MENTYEQLKEKYARELQEDLKLWESRLKKATDEKHKENCELRVYFLSYLLKDATRVRR